MLERKNVSEWILASASPRRQEILTRLGLIFHTDPSHLREPPCRPDEAPGRYVVRIARMKARESGEKYDSGFVIGADTVVVLGNRLLGKPASRDEASDMLARLSGRWHDVWSGLCLYDSRKRRSSADAERSRVHFRSMAASDIDWYLNTDEYRDKAGAYAVQGYASLFIDRIEGCYFNIVGFPVALFERLCRKAGIRLREHLKIQ
jgi:septum formation protein